MLYEQALNQFEQLKGQDIRTEEQLNILSKMIYRIYSKNKEQADEVWKYYIDTYNDDSGQKFYVVKLFEVLKKMPGNPGMFLLTRDEERINKLLRFTNKSVTKVNRACDIIQYFLRFNKVDDAVRTFCAMFKYTKKICDIDIIKQIADYIINYWDNVNAIVKISFFQKAILFIDDTKSKTVFDFSLYILRDQKDFENSLYYLKWIVESKICDNKRCSQFLIFSYYDLLAFCEPNFSKMDICKYINSYLNTYPTLSFPIKDSLSTKLIYDSIKEEISIINKLLVRGSNGVWCIQNMIKSQDWDLLQNSIIFLFQDEEKNPAVTKCLFETFKYIVKNLQHTEKKIPLFSMPVNVEIGDVMIKSSIEISYTVIEQVNRTPGMLYITTELLKIFSGVVMKALSQCNDELYDIKQLKRFVRIAYDILN